MIKTCDTCEWSARMSDMCCHNLLAWRKQPESNTCYDWKVHPLVQLGIDSENARCAKVCADRAAMLESTADQYPAGTGVGSFFC